MTDNQVDAGAPPIRGTSIDVQHDHRDVTGGWLRPAVFGAMDGLVSNLSLISGFSGAHAVRHLVILGGLGGLVAGAFIIYRSVKADKAKVDAEGDAETGARAEGK